MGLVDLRTDLKSLRFGKDRVGGGSSNQPYIQSPLPETLSDTNKTGGIDFLLRGGSLIPSRIGKDVSRITQMFFDFKSPNGLLFTAKQNLLSRANVKTQASPIAFNNGVYLPTSTILQTGVNALGIHLNKQGIDPFAGIGKQGGGIFGLFGQSDPLGQPVYGDVVGKNQPISDNRLIKLTEDKIYNISNNPSLLREYDGGPGSILGITGKTIINRVSNTRDWINSLSTKQSNVASWNPTQLQVGSTTTLNTNPNIGFGLAGAVNAAVTLANTLTGRKTRTNPMITDDFRSKITPEDPLRSNLPAKAINYHTKNIEKRINLGSPGQVGNKSNYQTGKANTDRKQFTPLDKLNALPLYKSKTPMADPVTDDLIDFRIGVIDNNTPSKKTYIHFRAFIDSFSDSYSSDWEGIRYMGRGEEFYRYGGFGRSIDLSWTVAAQSKEELIPQYQKLNYLASICAPDYSPEGYMRGNLITLTFGGYLYEQVGFINGVTFDVPQESPYEIAIPSSFAAGDNRDRDVKQLPHIIKVTGFKFTPIHDFVPRVQNNNFAGGGTAWNGSSLSDGTFVNGFGQEHYIALQNKDSNNYGNEDGFSDGTRIYTPNDDNKFLEFNPFNEIENTELNEVVVSAPNPNN